MQSPAKVNGNMGKKNLQVVMQPPPLPDLGNKSQASNEQAQYMSNVAETEEVIVKEKFIAFPQDHQLPNKNELRRKVHCEYHNSKNHSTNSYWTFRNFIQDKVNKEVTVNFLRENEVTVKFLGEKEVTIKFLREKEVMVKFFGGKEAMVIDEDLFPLTASINIDAIDLRAMLNAKKVRRFSPSTMVRNVWISKQYLTYKNNLVVKGRMSADRKWKNNGRYPYHSFEDSKHEAKNKKFSKEKNVSPKERHVSPREKGMNDPSRRKIPQRFTVPPIISPVQELHVVHHKKFLQKLTITQKRRMQRQRAMEKRQLPREMM